jgi:hypothetical protein
VVVVVVVLGYLVAWASSSRSRDRVAIRRDKQYAVDCIPMNELCGLTNCSGLRRLGIDAAPRRAAGASQAALVMSGRGCGQDKASCNQV